MSVCIRGHKCYRDTVELTNSLGTLHMKEVFWSVLEILNTVYRHLHLLVRGSFSLTSSSSKVHFVPIHGSDIQCWHLISENLTQLQLLVEPHMYLLQKSHKISQWRVKLVQKRIFAYLRSRVSLRCTEKRWRDKDKYFCQNYLSVLIQHPE